MKREAFLNGGSLNKVHKFPSPECRRMQTDSYNKHYKRQFSKTLQLHTKMFNLGNKLQNQLVRGITRMRDYCFPRDLISKLWSSFRFSDPKIWLCNLIQNPITMNHFIKTSDVCSTKTYDQHYASLIQRTFRTKCR